MRVERGSRYARGLGGKEKKGLSWWKRASRRTVSRGEEEAEASFGEKEGVILLEPHLAHLRVLNVIQSYAAHICTCTYRDSHSVIMYTPELGLEFSELHLEVVRAQNQWE